VDPTDPRPDYVIVLHTINRSSFGWTCMAEIQSTVPSTVTLELADLHRHVRREMEAHVWGLGYTVSALTWNDVEVRGGEPTLVTATGSLAPRDDDVWKSIRQAILEDEHDRRTLENQRAVEESLHRDERRRRRRGDGRYPWSDR
jgi:hypothetical protein